LATRGIATGVVIATGGQSEIGRIGQLVETVKPASTPLLEQIGRFNRWLTATIVAVAIALALFAILWRGMTFDEGFLAAVGFAVAAIPEACRRSTIALAVGVRRMARRHAIVRYLPAIETLGAVSVVCTDKTGTLTGNELTVRSLAIDGELLNVTGTGLEPTGDIQRDGRSLISTMSLFEAGEAGILTTTPMWHRPLPVGASAVIRWRPRCWSWPPRQDLTPRHFAPRCPGSPWCRSMPSDA
jgi:magnesium-transporting ATPase (P-type)